MSDFFKKLDLKYPEIGVLLEDAIMEYDKETFEWKKTKEKYKVTIPVLMPDMQSNDIIQKDIFHGSARVQASNYFELNIPKRFFPNPVFENKVPVMYEEGVDEKDKTVINYKPKVLIPKGTKLIIVFVGGSISIEDIKVIGIYDDID